MPQPKLERILYIEDEPDIQVIARMSLEKLGGFTVKICNSGKEALEEAPSFAPDFILLDVMMPEMDGPATLSSLRKIPALQNTPIVFLTAKTQPHEIEHYKTLGALDVIKKPFDAMILPQQVKALWAIWMKKHHE